MSYQLKRHKYLSDEELAEMQIKLEALGTRRDSLIIKLALATGARANELLNIRICDLHFADKVVWIIGIKNSNDRAIPIHNELWNELAHYVKLNELTNTQRLFDIKYRRLIDIWRKFHAPKPFHSLRHTFAIALYKRTKDVNLVQSSLGHRSIVSTMIYAQYRYTAAEMRALMYPSSF